MNTACIWYSVHGSGLYFLVLFCPLGACQCPSVHPDIPFHPIRQSPFYMEPGTYKQEARSPGYQTTHPPIHPRATAHHRHIANKVKRKVINQSYQSSFQKTHQNSNSQIQNIIATKNKPAQKQAIQAQQVGSRFPLPIPPNSPSINKVK